MGCEEVRMRPGRRYLYRAPIIVLIVAILLTGTLLGAKELVDERTAPTRKAPVLPATAGPTSALAVLDERAAAPTPGGVRTALARLLADRALGSGVLAQVLDAATGQVLLDRRSAVTTVPASTTKIATALTALVGLRPDAVLATRTALGTITGGTATVVLIGGGDPTLAGARTRPRYPDGARITDLAAKTAAALRQRNVRAVRVVIDDRLFSGPRLGPAWKPNYVPDGDVSPVTALSIDAGRLRPDEDTHTPDIRATDPPLTAGQQFAALLVHAGLPVRGRVVRLAAAASLTPLAAVTSPPVSTLVIRMLQRSDNDLAEALLRHVAIAQKQPATFVGGATAQRLLLPRLGIDPAGLHLVDGSGLSLADRLSPRVLTALLRLAADARHPELRPVLEGLPIAGFSGTLALRYRIGLKKVLPGPGAGLVRAKTGTLTGVSALAGTVLDSDGRLLVFAVLAPGVPIGGLTPAQTALDRIAARLAGCGCR
jgi:D-alanyl-D-alanine carboxypeptidase/D-alanyl-D-alanine-endopeptidase (penicillin-binding protein 4)